MYDELIESLRLATEYNEVLRNSPEWETMFGQAADAIEELWKKYLASEVDNTNLTGWLAEEHAKHLWIPVTERLPERHKNVLCCSARGGMFVGWFTNFSAISDGKTIAFEHGGINGRYVTHWMPLPEPPKEET